MRAAVMEQQHIHADQMARDQGKGVDYDGDEGSMYSEDMKGNGYGGSDAKKRRGVSQSFLNYFSNFRDQIEVKPNKEFRAQMFKQAFFFLDINHNYG